VFRPATVANSCQCQESLIVAQQDRLLDLRLADAIDQETFAHKSTEISDGLASIKLQIDALDRSHDEAAELEARGRLLNFLSPASGAGKPGYGVGWRAESLAQNEFALGRVGKYV
jgi:hypothetical protein